MTEDQLADLIAKDVRRHVNCEGFKSVSLYRLQEDEIAAGVNWSPGTANYGKAGMQVCDDALQEVIPRLQRQYRLVE
jgi:hypothetical protein